MAWARIQEGAVRHPKVVGLIDWKNPFCLWVWGLCYAQEHLTDGVILKAALPHPATLKTAQKLVQAGLWREEGAAFLIHDYLDWNDGREVIKAKREEARARASSSRARAAHVQRTSSRSVTLPERASGSSEGELERKPLPPASAARQVGRIFLHRWQLDALIDTLGPHAEGFGLDEWILSLSNSVDVLPAGGDRWAWIQAQLEAEVRRRHLPVATADAAPTNKRISGLVAGGEAFLRRNQA